VSLSVTNKLEMPTVFLKRRPSWLRHSEIADHCVPARTGEDVGQLNHDRLQIRQKKKTRPSTVDYGRC